MKKDSLKQNRHPVLKIGLLILLILPIFFYKGEEIIELGEELIDNAFHDSYVISDVPNYHQYPDAVNGCESYALTMALHTKGYALEYSAYEISEMIPMSDEFNPHLGYVGNQYVDDSMVATIYPDALIDFVREFAPNSYDATGFSINDLKREVKKGNPVIIWGSLNYFEEPNMYEYDFGYEPDNGHTVLMYGYTDDGIYISDSIYGYYWLPQKRIEQAYNARGRMAIVIK